MTAITFTAKDIAPADESCIIRNFRAGGTVSMGQAVYLNSSGYVLAADADASATTMKAIGIVASVGGQYGATSAASGRFVGVCVKGALAGFTGMTPGAFVWVSKTAGELEDALPSSAWGRVMGQAHSATVLFVSPGTENPVSA